LTTVGKGIIIIPGNKTIGETMNTNTGADDRTIKQIIRQELPLLMKNDKIKRGQAKNVFLRK
jgi:hypothetical protein